MSLSPSKTLLFASGPITFSSLRSSFKEQSSGSVSASDLRRDTSTSSNPVVPDATENSAVSSSSNLSLSQFRNTIKYYFVTQSGTDANLNIASASAWNNNLGKNIKKTITLTGISGSTNGNPAASLDAAAIYNVLLVITGGIFGTGGSRGTETTNGGPGGNALYINTNGTGTVAVRTSGSSAQVYGGGGGGGGGGDGGSGGGGQYTVSYTERVGTGYNRNGPGGCGCRGGEYCSGSQGNGDPCCGGGQGTPGECFCCFYDRQVYYTVNTNGGGGGDGADGGYGQGYLQARTLGGTGGGGGGGGTNAGRGGDGGDGGDGGTWAQNGENGERGDNGSSGNRTGGSAGVNGTLGGLGGRAVSGSGYFIDPSGVDSAYIGAK